MILENKGISRNKLSIMLAVGYNLVNRYYKNSVIRVDIDIIARICYVLNCDITDILKYKNNSSS